jgi:glutathione synthase/RimK-type ligase-like ATP-grasp enzyme
MTPKDKAEELIEKYLNMNDGLIQEFIPIPLEGARQCALVAVDEIMKAIDFDWMEVQNLESEHRYWQEVKQEIEKL